MRAQEQSSLKGGRAHYPVCFVSAFLPTTLVELLLPSKFSGFVGHGLVKGCFFEFVGQVVDMAHFLVKKRHVGQVTNRGEASRTQNRDVGQVLVRRQKIRRFLEYLG